MKPELINRLIAKREEMTSRRDGLYDHRLIDKIDERLATVPPGTRNDVDLLLGRRAELPERVEYQLRPNSTQAEIDRQQRIYEQLSAVKEVWSTSEQRAEWKDTGAAQIEQAAQEKQDDYLRYIADQHEDRLDFLRLCGDLAI